MTKTRNLVYFPNLDALRLFCFLSVFLFHSFPATDPVVNTDPVYKLIRHDLFSNGYLGVNFFFVLSGFLITYLLLTEKIDFSKIHVGKFYLRRILRIWPLFYFCVFFGFVLFPILKKAFGMVPNENASAVYYLSFLNNFDTIKKGYPDSSVLGILWSVAIEEQFYLVWPLVIGFIPAKKLPYVFAVIITGSFIFRVAHADNFMITNSHTISCISDMTVGGLGAWLAIFSTRFKTFIGNLPRLVILFIYLAVLFLFLFRARVFEHGAVLISMERLVLSVLFILVILEQNYANHSLFKLQTLRRTSRLGKYTYGLYCLHPIALLVTDVGLNKFGLTHSIFQIVVIGGLVSIALAFLMAWISFHYFESWFLNLKNRFEYVRTANAKAPATHA